MASPAGRCCNSERNDQGGFSPWGAFLPPRWRRRLSGSEQAKQRARMRAMRRARTHAAAAAAAGRRRQRWCGGDGTGKAAPSHGALRALTMLKQCICLAYNEHRRAKRWTALLCSPTSHLPAKSQGAAAPVPALVSRESPVVFDDRLLRTQWGGMARKDASEGYKVTSVRSFVCGQATAPKEDEQGMQR